MGDLYPYFAYLRNGPDVALLNIIVLLVVASDSGAYFVGKSLGRTNSEGESQEDRRGRNWRPGYLYRRRLASTAVANSTLGQAVVLRRRSACWRSWAISPIRP